MKTKIDLEQLRVEIRQLKHGQLLYKVLQEELSAIGHWKNLGRGNPIKAYQSRGRK